MNYLDRINQLTDQLSNAEKRLDASKETNRQLRNSVAELREIEAALSSRLCAAEARLEEKTEENRKLNRSNDMLRSQLSDARKQLEADSATIAKLAKDKRELVSALRGVTRFANMGFETSDCDTFGIHHNEAVDATCEAEKLLSRHA